MGISSADLLSIPIEYIVPNGDLPGDVYFKLSEHNFVVIGRKGTREKFKSLHFYEKIKNAVYILKSDLRNFSSLKVLSARDAMKNDSNSTLQNVDILSQAMDSVFTSVNELGFTSDALGSTKFIASTVLKIIQDNPKLSTLMDLMNSISTDLVRHSMAVSMVSTLIAQSKGWNNPSILEKIALGAILHDIGLKEYPSEFLSKPRSEYSPEDTAHYQRHAFRGLEILKTIENVPEEVMAIVAEHHENSAGRGYPRAIRDVRLHPFSKIVALADSFCELTFKDSQNPNPVEPDQALHLIEFHLGQPFNKDCFNALKNILTLGIKRASIKIV